MQDRRSSGRDGGPDAARPAGAPRWRRGAACAKAVSASRSVSGVFARAG